MSKNIWVIGPACSLNKYTNLISKLSNKATIVLGKVFPHCIKHFNIHPTFWTWFDPHETCYGKSFLKNNPNYNIDVLLPSPVLKSKNNFEKYYPQGNSFVNSVRNEDISWEEYEQLLDNKQLNIEWVESTTMQRLWFEKSKYRKIEGWKPEFKELAIKLSENPNYRFNKYDKVVINTHYCSFEENTLNRLILPLCHYKGYKKVFILGFDGFPGRFYSNDVKPNIFKWRTSPYVGRFDNLKKWVEWKPYTNMEILSVIPGPIDNHIPGINFEQALEIDNETNN